MRRRKPVIALALAVAASFWLPAGTAHAELHSVSVVLVTGQSLTMTIDVPPGSSIESLAIPGLPAPVLSVTDLGVIATPTSGSTAQPADLTTESQPPAAAPPAYLLPFPVVRIRGSLVRHGAKVTLFRVSAPPGATVTVRCAGDGCPARQLTTGPGRLHAFERFLRAGVRITIRVRRGDTIGKYVRLRIRARRPPARHDACVLPGSRGPDPCPLI
jgi:hypothetical protein